MPSSYTDIRFELQFTGENINLWGDKLNTVLTHADYAIAGWLTKALTTSPYALSTANAPDDEARAAMIKFTGTGAFQVTIPAVSKSYFLYNACTGAITVTTGSGTTAVIDSGAKVLVFCDGTNVHQQGYAGLALKDYIDAAVMTATGSLPATAGNNGKVLACVVGAWTPTLIDSTYINGFSATATAVRLGTSLTAALTPGDTYNGLAEVALTSASNHIAADMSTFVNAFHQMTENTTLDNATSKKVGQTGHILIRQHASAAKTLAVGSDWKRVGGALAIGTTLSGYTVLHYKVTSAFGPLGRRLQRPVPAGPPPRGDRRLGEPDHDRLLTGVCRAVFPWTDNSAVLNIAFGTHSKLQVWQGGALYDITPFGPPTASGPAR
jgi:hypothetical protein